jgi:hypothetical protein
MRVRALLVGFVFVATGVLGAGSASASTVPGAIAMYSDPGDYIGQDNQQLFTGPTNVTGNAGDVTIDVGGTSWSMRFAAPPGQALQPGIYDNAGRAAFRADGQAGIDVYGDGRGCNTDFGRFEVKDIAFDSSGLPNRLWLIYEQHCEGGQPALFGEVRLGEPANAALTPVATLVRWPANDHGTPETVVPVRFVATSPDTVSSVGLGGDDPSDFAIRSDGCTGEVLAAGGFCDVWVRSTPSVPGLRAATLVVRDTGGRAYTVTLQGWTYGGTTRLVTNSDPGDWIGNGQQASFDPSNAVFSAAGTPEHVSFSLDTGSWMGDFAPSRGDILTAGSTWTGAQRYPFQGSSPGMDINSPGRGCNTVTGQFSVIDATYHSDGSVRSFGVRFEQHCEGAQPALRGEFDWRVGDNTPPAPWMAQTDFTSPPGAGSSAGGSSSTPGGNSATPSGGSSPGSTGGAGASTQGGATSSSGAASQSGGTPTGGAAVKPANPPSSGSSGSQTVSPATAKSLARALLRVRNDVNRLNRVLGQLRRNPANQSQRHAALTAFGKLRLDVIAMAHVLRAARPSGTTKLTAWRRLEGAISAWQRALLAEQRSFTSRRALPARTWSLDARARALGVTALEDLVRFAHTL